MQGWDVQACWVWTALQQAATRAAASCTAVGLMANLLLQAERVLDGQWKLVYTSNSELFGLLALSRLPFVIVGDITQTVQASTLTVENKVRHGRHHPAHASIKGVQHCKPDFDCEALKNLALECIL